MPIVEVYKKIERFAARVDIRKSLDAWVLAQSMKAYNKNHMFICDTVLRVMKNQFMFSKMPVAPMPPPTHMVTRP